MGRPVHGSGRVTRDEQAERTRTRILDAAREEFIASGFGGANMADIAERAGVSVQMVYFAFGRKGRLFSAVMQRAVFGDDGVPPPHTEWWRRLGEHPTARDVLREFIERNGPVFAAAAPIAFVGRVGALEDADLAEEGRLNDRLRYEGVREVVALAATKGAFQPGYDVDSASDVLASLLSPATYVEFTTERGWSHERTMAWLADTVPGLLFA